MIEPVRPEPHKIISRRGTQTDIIVKEDHNLDTLQNAFNQIVEDDLFINDYVLINTLKKFHELGFNKIMKWKGRGHYSKEKKKYFQAYDLDYYITRDGDTIYFIDHLWNILTD